MRKFRGDLGKGARRRDQPVQRSGGVTTSRQSALGRRAGLGVGRWGLWGGGNLAGSEIAAQEGWKQRNGACFHRIPLAAVSEGNNGGRET